MTMLARCVGESKCPAKWMTAVPNMTETAVRVEYTIAFTSHMQHLQRFDEKTREKA